MARGGGTGSRTNKKKKTDVASIKHKNNKQTSRKQKEETPPVPVVEEDTKEEKAKLVPTSEQLRLAQITQSQDNTMDPQRKAKISQVMDITGKSEDEVATALFDCGWDPARAIDMLLEEGGADGMGSWEETGKKKKKKNVEEEKGAGKENEDWNDDFDPNNKFDDNRERSRQRGPPRLRSRGGGQGMSREEQGNWKARENQENDRNNYEGGRGRGRGGLARGGRGGAVGGRGGGPIGGQRGGRGGGQRGFGDQRNIDSRVVERREPGSVPGELPGRPGESFGQIETWNPVGEPAGPGSAAAGGAPGPVQQPGVGAAPGEGQLRARRGPVGNSKDAFDNAGNWGDDFPAAEDWDNDEYTGSLSDTKVFTPSGSGVGPKSAIGEPLNGEARNGAAVQQPSLAAPGSKTQPSPANNSLSGSSYPQPIDISALLQKPGGLTGAPGGPTSLSQYQQAATKDLKSAIGLAPGQSSLSYSSAAPGSSFASAAPGSAFSPIKPAAVTNGSNSASKALPRARLPPPSKIPSSAVEMPGDSLSNLDVQFGGLDLQFGGSNNENNSTNFDFGAGSPPSQKQDLEKERLGAVQIATSIGCCQQSGIGSDARGIGAYQGAVHNASNVQGGQVLMAAAAPPPGLQHLQQMAQHRSGTVLPMPVGGSTILPQQRPGQMLPSQVMHQGPQLLSSRLQSGQLIQSGVPARGQLPPSSFSRASGGQLVSDSSNMNSDHGQGHVLHPSSEAQGQQGLSSSGTAGLHMDGSRTSAISQGIVNASRTILAQSEVTSASSDLKLGQDQGLQWSKEVEEEERLARQEQSPPQQAEDISNKSQGTGQSSQGPMVVGEWETVKPYGRGKGASKETLQNQSSNQSKHNKSDTQGLPASVQSQAGLPGQGGVRGVLPVPGHLRRDQATSVSGLMQASEDGGQHQGLRGGGGVPAVAGKEPRSSLPHTGDDLARFSSIPPGAPGKPESVGPTASLDSYKAQGASQSAGVKDVGQSLSSALASAGIKPSSSTDSVPGYGRVGEAGGSSRSSETGKSQGYGAQRSPGPLLAKTENLGGYNNGPSYSGYQGGKAGQGFPQSSGYPGGFDRQQSYNSGSSSNGLTGGYSSRGGGSSAYNPPREPSYSNSYGGGSGAVNSSSSTNYGSNFGASTTNYSPYTGSNSYSSSSNNKSSSQQSSSNYSNSAATTSTGPSSQFSGESGSTTAGSGKTGSSYDSTQTSSSAGTYGGVGQSSSTGSNVSSLGLSANSTLSSSSKMSVNTTSGKMVPGMPPGVPGVLPAQYMIGAGGAAGFPAYLANLGQAPAMAAYGGYGVGGHQLEDLAALQRSTLAASLPQLVGNQAGGAAATPAPGKGPNSGYYDPASQFGGGSAGAAGSLASRQSDPTSSFPSDTSGKFGSAGDSTSSPVPSSVAQQTQQQQQPTPFNALASTFAAAAPQQHPTLPPGYAYFYGGVGNMGAQLAAAAYGQGLPAAAGYPATHPGIPAPTVAGPTNTTQFQKQAYGSSYGNSYGDSLSLGQSNTGYKNSYGQSESQGKSNTSGSSAGHSGGPAYWTSTNGLW